MPRGVKKVSPIKTVSISLGHETFEVSQVLKETINHVRPKFMGFMEDYTALTTKKGELAEPFMDAAFQFQKETSRSFVDFVRVLDPTVPADREGYRVHKTYMAADYLRRSVTVGGARGQGNGDSRRTSSPTRTNAVGRMARLLSTLLQIVKPEDHGAIWQALADELALTPRQVTGMKAAVDATQPLFTLPIKRKVSAEVVHIEQPAIKAA